MKTKILIATAAMAVIALSAKTEAAILLNINDSNPSAVYFDYNGSNSVSTTSISELFGIDLLGFFQHTNPPASGSIISGDTTPAGTGTLPYSSYAIDFLSGSYKDLNLTAATSVFQHFVIGSPAFTQGHPLVIDLSAYAADLPGVGSLGVLYAGNTVSPNNSSIGSWKVVAVPEPSTYALFGIGALLLVVVARRKQTA